MHEAFAAPSAPKPCCRSAAPMQPAAGIAVPPLLPHCCAVTWEIIHSALRVLPETSVQGKERTEWRAPCSPLRYHP